MSSTNKPTRRDRDRRSWEPEPLHLPIDVPAQRPRRGDDGGRVRRPDSNPGSNVVIIDLA